MNRWLVRICVFLMLGAIVNVAVAWGCATYGESLERQYLNAVISSGELQHWFARVPRNWSKPESSATFIRLGVSGFWAWGPVDQQLQWTFQEIREFGLPLRSMHVQRQAVANDWWGISGDLWTPKHLIDGIALPERVFGPGASERLLPVLPIWPGFAMNTVFYAFVLWLLFAGPFVLRRRRRIRRGLCPKCAYDLRGTPEAQACPECGNT